MRRTLEKSSKNNQRFVGGREGKRPKRILAKTIGEKSVENFRGCVAHFLNLENVSKSSKRF